MIEGTSKFEVNPVKSKVEISIVKSSRNGSVILSCNKSEDTEQLQIPISEKLKADSMKQLSTLNPCARK